MAKLIQRVVDTCPAILQAAAFFLGKFSRRCPGALRRLNNVDSEQLLYFFLYGCSLFRRSAAPTLTDLVRLPTFEASPRDFAGLYRTLRRSPRTWKTSGTVPSCCYRKCLNSHRRRFVECQYRNSCRPQKTIVPGTLRRSRRCER